MDWPVVVLILGTVAGVSGPICLAIWNRIIDKRRPAPHAEEDEEHGRDSVTGRILQQQIKHTEALMDQRMRHMEANEATIFRKLDELQKAVDTLGGTITQWLKRTP